MDPYRATMLRLVSPGDESYLAAIEEYFKNRMANARRLLKLSGTDSQDYSFEVLLLCCCALDAIGNMFLIDDQHEDGGKDKERFHELLWRYGEKDGFRFDRVNMISLRRKLQTYGTQKRIALPRTLSYVESEIARHAYGVNNAIDLDLPFDEIERIARELLTQDGQIARWRWLSTAIRESTHAGVLYEEYRCGAVHRMLVSGHWGSTRQRDTRPFYMPVIGEGVDFTFPEAFLVALVENVLHCILYDHLAPDFH